MTASEDLILTQCEQRLCNQDNKWPYQASNHHDFTLECSNLLKFSFFDVLCQAVKRNQHRKYMSATSGKDAPTHGSFGPLCGSRTAERFQISLNARTKQLDTSIGAASVITWAFADTAGLEPQDSDCVHMEGIMHASIPNLAEIVGSCLQKMKGRCR